LLFQVKSIKEMADLITKMKKSIPNQTNWMMDDPSSKELCEKLD
jgi:hypothetical protein